MEEVKMKVKSVFAFVAASLLAVCFLVPSARAQYPTGADVSRSVIETNISVTLSNTSTLAASVSADYVYSNTNSAVQRVRLLGYGDSALLATGSVWANYASFIQTNTAGTTPLGTNSLWTTGSNGIPVVGTAAAPFVSQRPALWKGNVSFRVTADNVPGKGTAAGSTNVITGTLKVIDETGSY
jgi:hypothetical protein